MKRRLFAAAVGGALILAATGGATASAGQRQDPTITEVCALGGGKTSDVNSYSGTTTSEVQYNAHNPLGDSCSVVNPP